MLEIAKIVGGAVHTYPVEREVVLATIRGGDDTVDASLPRDLTGLDLSEWGYAVVYPTDAPATLATEIAERAGIEKVGGRWQWAWAVRAKTPEELHGPVPEKISMRQARLALHSAGAYETVVAMIEATGGAALIEWEYATEVRRDHPLIAVMAASLDLDDEAVDQMFRDASQIP